MFTGIITGVGRIAAVHAIRSLEPSGSKLDPFAAPFVNHFAAPCADHGTDPFGKRLRISAPNGYLNDVGLGDSIAINGACMTVTSLDADKNEFTLDISAESLQKTANLAQVGTALNLEKALRASDRLGGHIVAGHVDGTGTISFFASVGESWELRIICPPAIAKFIAYKGSITVNGVSLTVNQVVDSNADGAIHTELSINLIPHTLENTALGSLKTGDTVNLEIDTVARYVERMLSFEKNLKGKAMTALSHVHNNQPAPVKISPVEDIIADMAGGKIVILVDEEDRENEGDLILASDFVSADAINFMAKFGRGLICLTLTKERCEHLNLPSMAARNGGKYSTAFTVSIEAAEGVTTGISAADRAVTVQAAVAKNAKASDLIQPGHIFPLQAVDGGVLMRAGHTEAGCDLARLAGCSPSSVICEIMNDDGTMARLPDLQLFAAEHGLKIGTIADLIEHRSRTESLITQIGLRVLHTAFGEFTARAYQDKASGGVHMALLRGHWSSDESVLVRVHEPLSVIDLLEQNRTMHAWSLDAAMKHIADKEQGIIVLLNCGESAAQLLAQFEGSAKPAQAPERGRMDLRTYGIGAQILRDCGIHKMTLMANPRPLPSVTGFGLEVTSHLPQPI